MEFEEIIKLYISAIGDDPNREGLKDTPKRVTKMLQEVFQGYFKYTKPKITVFNNGNDGVWYNQMVIDTGYFYSYCEHHMIPFFGQYYFGYVPDKKILGLSKVARIIDWYSSRLQIQERLTKEVVDEFNKLLKPKGIILILKARHLCKEMRGVKKVNGEMITSEVRGVFEKEINTRQEFLSLINSQN